MFGVFLYVENMISLLLDFGNSWWENILLLVVFFIVRRGKVIIRKGYYIFFVYVRGILI